MDEVLEKFESTLISQEPTKESKTNFDGLYKNWGKLGNQEERRREILEVQKSNRNDKIDRFRGILELVNAVEQNEIFKTHHTAYYRPTIYVAGFNKTSPTYSNVLMMSEWMIEKPVDFNENWYVVPCPKGVRMLVVSNRGNTKMYTKYGHFRFMKRTALPGGNSREVGNRHKCCVLDCFYQESINTMFILDLLAWNCQPMTDGETEFRHYWLESQLSELPGLGVLSKKNEMIFKLLPKVPCTSESFNNFMMKIPMFENNSPALDGLLFYHKRAHYVAGETPLVGWLFPFMVPDILGSEITVNEMYKKEKPEGYVSQVAYIQKFEEKYSKKKLKSRRTSITSTNSMDTSDSKDETVPKKKSGKNKNKNKNKEVTEVMEAEQIPEQIPKQIPEQIPDQKPELKTETMNEGEESPM